MPHQLVVAISGGGTAAIASLLSQPGASRWVLEATVPYHPESLRRWIGGTVDQAASESTARQMAVAARDRAASLLGREPADADDDPPVACGLGCTAALATDRQRQGSDRAFVVLHSRQATESWSIDLGVSQYRPGEGSTRADQEQMVQFLILSALQQWGFELAGQALQQAPTIRRPPTPRRERCDAPEGWRALLEGQIPYWIEPSQGAFNDSTATSGAPLESNPLLFPGSFNPLHPGHREMIDIAQQRFSRPVWLELSVVNADKPPLDYLTIRERVDKLRGSGDKWLLSGAARFDQKAELFPGAIFLVGADTAMRIADPKFYARGAQGRDDAMHKIAQAGCRFLVFGRLGPKGFLPADDLPLPESLQRLCVPETAFRHDISSTKLRRQQQDG